MHSKSGREYLYPNAEWLRSAAREKKNTVAESRNSEKGLMTLREFYGIVCSANVKGARQGEGESEPISQPQRHQLIRCK